MFSSFPYNKVICCKWAQMFYKFSMHGISNVCHKMEARKGEWQHFAWVTPPFPTQYPWNTLYLCPPPTSPGRMRQYLENSAIKINRKTCMILDWCLSLSGVQKRACAVNSCVSVGVCMSTCVARVTAMWLCRLCGVNLPRLFSPPCNRAINDH